MTEAVAAPADIAAGLAAARAAGAVALAMQRGITARPKSDGSPVTEADLAADREIRRILLAAFPGDALLSEEAEDDHARLAARRVWIVDPIDGTREYAAGGSAWAVQVALAVDGRLVLGVLAMPALGLDQWGAPGLGAWECAAAGERPLAPRRTAATATVLVASDSRRNREALARLRAALPELACITSTSVGVKVQRMLAGDAGLYVHSRQIREWDAAAPAAVLAAAGGHATAMDGGPLRWNTPSARCTGGLLFSLRDDHRGIAARLAAAGIAIGD